MPVAQRGPQDDCIRVNVVNGLSAPPPAIPVAAPPGVAPTIPIVDPASPTPIIVQSPAIPVKSQIATPVLPIASSLSSVVPSNENNAIGNNNNAAGRGSKGKNGVVKKRKRPQTKAKRSTIVSLSKRDKRKQQNRKKNGQGNKNGNSNKSEPVSFTQVVALSTTPNVLQPLPVQSGQAIIPSPAVPVATPSVSNRRKGQGNNRKKGKRNNSDTKREKNFDLDSLMDVQSSESASNSTRLSSELQLPASPSNITKSLHPLKQKNGLKEKGGNERRKT